MPKIGKLCGTVFITKWIRWSFCDLGLEWLGRLIKEPKRMWKRYIYYGVAFSYYLLREKIRTVKWQ